jgi:hypothetical protein
MRVLKQFEPMRSTERSLEVVFVALEVRARHRSSDNGRQVPLALELCGATLGRP